MDVSRVVLGCGNFGGVGSDLSLVGWGDDEDAAFALMDAAWERGIRAFDTASSYGGGASERMIGRWIASRRPEGLRLTSKVFHPAPLGDTLDALAALVAEGRIGGIGLSNVDGAYLGQALSLAPIEVVQNEYSLLTRESEQEVLPLCAERGIGFEAFSPLGGGWLTGKYRRGESFPAGSRMTLRPDPYEAWRSDDVFDALEALEERGDPATLALAWVLSRPGVTAAVVGPRRPEHLEPVFAALDAEIERDELTELFTWSR